MAQRAGTEPPCADGLDVQRRGLKVCAAVVDGAGHHENVVRYAAIAPAVMTHLGMALGGLAGLITAGQMAHAYEVPPHASAVYVCMEPGWPTAVHWLGDCRAYAWDGTTLVQVTTDATMGQWLRRNGGVPVEIAAAHDNWSRLGLARACAATCRQIEVPEDIPLVLLLSDGISDQVDQVDQVDRQTMVTLCARHETDPQALADALTAAAKEDVLGYRDDATIIAMRWGAAPPDRSACRSIP
ncbi:hypothetical protein CP968_01360 [Streptomyces subrutilus]|uniref:PPM-type phosphatase domain-containing protein n=1 Tax=Streptomyces subrutilus TaxID=36818 RepID=A0A5P2UUR5_9ACTN|nr:hypothetical protein CP968_01360 [Streptomyces subrutilus]